MTKSRLINFLLSISLIASCTDLQADNSTAPMLTLAKTYQGETDLKHYWVSEKLDGVRAYWNGQQLISRQGNIYPAPAWFTQDFPTQALDGELWLGRQQFQSLLSIVRKKQAVDNEWRNVRYFVFDQPQLDKPFSQRLKSLQQLVTLSKTPYLQIVKQFRVKNKIELQQQLDRIISLGGEGLMLHRADAYYHAGRNKDLLKVKPYTDAEAKVIAYIAGKGKYTGMMGALLVEMSTGIQFKIGTGFSDVERANPAKIGSLITYKYHGKTDKGIPKFASFLRIRKKVIDPARTNHDVKPDNPLDISSKE